MLAALLLLLAVLQCHGWQSPIPTYHSKKLLSCPTRLKESSSSSYVEPNNQFGNQDCWDKTYTQESEFSWYCGWEEELEPFFKELVPDTSAKVLIPGIGNDGCIRDMFDSGYTHLTAFDYAHEGVECAKRLFGQSRLKLMDDMRVADARSLPYDDQTYDAVLDKGTLDSIYLSGGMNKDLARQHLGMAVEELARVLKKGGIAFCVTAACVDSVQESFDACNEERGCWKQLRDGSIHITDDGYTSNNVDATMLVWERI